MSVVFIISKVVNYSLKTIIFKTIASLFFVALGIVNMALNPNGPFLFKLFTVLGLFFGMLGDLLLGFKYITTKTKNIWILAGMFSFAFGHICYILGLFLGFYTKGEYLFLMLPFITATVISALYLLIAPRLGVDFGKMTAFGIFYLLCLTTMVSAAIYMTVLHSFLVPSLIMFLVGALNFIASDFMLTGAYFKPGQRSKPYMAIYSVFYYVAQFVIAFSIYFLV